MKMILRKTQKVQNGYGYAENLFRLYYFSKVCVSSQWILSIFSKLSLFYKSNK